MSDFDKEAEREKLREKYERDQAEREATQRMSDLLLKGARMTNAHCGTCGDPLFQQDDTTFCPSCHGNPDAVQGTNLEAQPAESTAGGADGGQGAPAAAESAGDEDVDPDIETKAADAADSTPEPSPDHREQSFESHSQSSVDDASDRSASTAPSQPTSASPTPSPASAASRAGESGGDGPNRLAADAGQSNSSRSPGSSQPTDGDRDDARASLVRALEKWADEAATADDPRYATECLEAAREASETLNTLR